MKTNLPARELREHPDLDQLNRQAKELQEAFTAGDAAAAAEVNQYYRGADRNAFALHHSQLVLARSYGFDSWPKLKAYVDGATIKRLAELVSSGDVAQVRAMLKVRPELANMEMAYNDERCALHFAVLNRAPGMVRLLMQQGADARRGIYPHREDTTALRMAAERGYDEIAAIIQEEEQHRRESQTALTATLNSKVTPAQDELSEAISEGDEARAMAMLQEDPALVQACDRDGWTPLHVAAAALNERMVAWLVEHGADVNRRGKEGRTPIDLAAAGRGRRNASRAEQFASVAATLRRRGAGLTPRSAVAAGEVDWLRTRHAEGTLANPVDWSSGGLLTVAVDHDRPAILEMLLDFGFDPDERVRWGDADSTTYSQGYPLWHAAAQGKQEIAEMLLKRGANPNVHVDSSGSSVYSAYSHRQWAMVLLLRRYGGVVGPDIAGVYRETELARQMLASPVQGSLAEGEKAVAEELLEHGASGGDPEIVRMALEHIDWPRDDARWFWILGKPLGFWNHIPWLYAGNPEFDRGTYITCFRLVLERCSPNLIGRFGRTMLHEVAALDEHVTAEEGVRFATALLDAGARLDVRDDLLRSTPLGWACRWGRVELVRLLLERGAGLVEADAEAWATPRAWAKKMAHGEVCEELERHGR